MKNEILEKVYNARKNLIVNGDIQTGKTTNVMFPLIQEMINNNESLMILDSKEEYLNKYYKELQDKNYNVVIINLKDFDKSEGWNPLEYPYKLYKNGNVDKALNYLEKISKATFREENTTDSYWIQTSLDFFIGASLALFEDGKKDEINLLSIFSIFNGMNKKTGIDGDDFIKKYFETKSPDSLAYIYASATAFAPSSTKESIISVARQKLRVLITREKLNKLISKTTFNFNDIVNKPTAVFLITNEENNYLNTLSSIFIEQLFSVLMDSKLKNKFNFILDNFDSIETLKNLSVMLSTGISNNIKTSIVTRCINQLYTTYSDYLKSLCNVITVTYSSIDLVIDNKNQNIDNEYKESIYKKADIKYPQLIDSEIKKFDLIKLVEEKCTKDLSANQNTPSKNIDKLNSDDQPKFINNFDIDQIIERIDKKIDELSKEMENEKKAN